MTLLIYLANISDYILRDLSVDNEKVDEDIQYIGYIIVELIE